MNPERVRYCVTTTASDRPEPVECAFATRQAAEEFTARAMRLGYTTGAIVVRPLSELLARRGLG